ncbi:MAG: hypothetical protein CMQ46_00190, partial [Gammaproteobacteria bacterium]|nr:hypothetical protein [Gammaproteobacteria bacterium]
MPDKTAGQPFCTAEGCQKGEGQDGPSDHARRTLASIKNKKPLPAAPIGVFAFLMPDKTAGQPFWTPDTA